jgi:hypothetical protein
MRFGAPTVVPAIVIGRLLPRFVAVQAIAVFVGLGFAVLVAVAWPNAGVQPRTSAVNQCVKVATMAACVDTRAGRTLG